MILLCFVSKEKLHAPIFLNGLTKAVLRVSCSFKFYRRAGAVPYSGEIKVSIYKYYILTNYTFLYIFAFEKHCYIIPPFFYYWEHP
ncbi:hypothetical protein [Inovirus D_HF35_23]|nr:hypothetical protein [Inovirus D_HF35_23]